MIDAIILGVLVTIVMSEFLKHKSWNYINQPSTGILVGFCYGYLLNYVLNSRNEELLFNKQVFFQLILPIIIFNAGFNLNKHRFLQNILHIIIFGLFGTILSFIILMVFTHIANVYGIIVPEGANAPIQISTYMLLKFSATMSATDSVSALTLIDPLTEARLFSIIFGEGIANDAVSIILYKSVGKYNRTEFATYPDLLLEFLMEFACSTGLGIVLSGFLIWIFRKLAFLKKNPSAECIFVIALGYVTYMAAELIELSGVISVLVSGIMINHYLMYNISSKSRLVFQNLIETFSFYCENSVYLYLGVETWIFFGWTPPDYTYSYRFMLYCVPIVILARSVPVYLLSFLINKINRKNRLTFFEITVTCLSGFVRGSVAFALILGLNDKKYIAQ